jgi:hypothetical protein
VSTDQLAGRDDIILQQALVNKIQYPNGRLPIPLELIILIKKSEHETNLLSREAWLILLNG